MCTIRMIEFLPLHSHLEIIDRIMARDAYTSQHVFVTVTRFHQAPKSSPKIAGECFGVPRSNTVIDQDDRPETVRSPTLFLIFSLLSCPPNNPFFAYL